MNSAYEIRENHALIKINSNLYEKEVLLNASYSLLDDFYFLLDENENYFEIFMRPKEKTLNFEEFEKEILNFFDELIESSAYIDQLKRTSGIRESILESALFSQKKLDENNK